MRRFNESVDDVHHPLCAAEDRRKQAVVLGEHCLSSAAVRDVCALPGRVAQPRLFVSIEGTAQAWPVAFRSKQRAQGAIMF
jgi:hypothetical protein